jgi:cytochrome c oxidase subunit 2
MQPHPQSVLEPAGPIAERIGGLWNIALGTSAVVYVLVIAALLYASLHRRRPAAVPVVELDARRERGVTLAVAIATGLSTLVLVVFFVIDLGVQRAVTSGSMHEHSTVTRAAQEAPVGALRVKVTGYQWWWRIEYLDPTPSRRLVTANELNIPVGRPVAIEFQAGDVIHSFWVPNLSGKRDLVPGRTTRLTIQADEPGVYRGQCAEFCGHQHAKMALHVIAQPAADFDRWYEEGLQPAATPSDSLPSDSLRHAGMQVFLAKPCAMCHNINGLPASGQVGPDLTHLASRRTIGAGVLPNTKGHLGGWILNPQAIKPGTRMPPNGLSPNELEALLAYLGGLR